MKKFAVVFMVLSLLLSSCGKADSKKTAMEIWLDNANLNEEETPDTLYKKALKEDILTVYTVSSRLFDVAESFKEQYPGLEVNIENYRVEDLVGRIEENASAKAFDCDVVYCTNGEGSLTENLLPKGLVYKYLPYDMKDKMLETGNESYLSVLLEMSVLFYNDTQYEKPPISNWWELTEPEWKNRLYITDPSKSMISYTLFSMMEKYDTKMKEAYLEHFGEEFVPEGEESIAKTYIRKLMENGLHVVNDSDDVAEAVAGSGSDGNVLGIMNASKLRMRDQGYPLMACYEMTPFSGVINPADIMVVGGAKNINTAKLFIRWIMGEKDGTGKGYAPFLQDGAWPARTDVKGEAKVKLEDIPAIYTDENFTYTNRDEFLRFWDSCVKEYIKE